MMDKVSPNWREGLRELNEYMREEGQRMMDEPVDEKYCIPLVVVVGEKNQFLFPFMRGIYEQMWHPYPVRLACDTQTP
jgi:hypothetical protein